MTYNIVNLCYRKMVKIKTPTFLAQKWPPFGNNNFKKFDDQ